MFPGYASGETTQRVAAGLFDAVKDYAWGIQFAGFKLPGTFVEHVRMMETGYNDAGLADGFGLPFVMTSAPDPIDTATLNYNWQVFGARAYSLYSRETRNVHIPSSMRTVKAVQAFMNSIGLTNTEVFREPSVHFREESLVNVSGREAGIFLAKKSAGDTVRRTDVLYEIIDPLTGKASEEARSPCDGVVFFVHSPYLITQFEIAMRILPVNA
jgi:predicted deacylase